LSDPIRLLHFADLHVGMENYGKLDPQTGISSRIRDFLDRLDEIVDFAFAHDADLVVFAGDAFKTRDPDPTQQREFARRIKKLADRIPVFMLVGNHDIPGMAARATSIDIFRTLEVGNIIVGRNIGSQVVETRRGPVFLGWVPFPVRGRLIAQDDQRGASVEELDRAVGALISGELGDLARQAAEQAMPRVLVGHFTVSGATYGSERSVMLGRDLIVQKSALADPAWDYVALGHIHKHQNLTPAHPRGAQPADQEAGAANSRLPPIVYSGSLERIDFGEEVEDKGFCWVKLERGDTTWEFCRVHARPFRSIKVDAREEADPTAAVVAAIQARGIEGAVVRVQIALREGQEAALRRRELEAALAPAANVAAISVEVERTTRVAGLGASPESLTPLEWLERYFASKHRAPERLQRLLSAADRILKDDA
jgi:DNA repair protein SbcD/Mre11